MKRRDKKFRTVPAQSLQRIRACQDRPANASYIGRGVGCTSPGSGGVDSGMTGSGGGALGLMAIFFFQEGFEEGSGCLCGSASSGFFGKSRIMASPISSGPSEGRSRSSCNAGSSLASALVADGFWAAAAVSFCVMLKILRLKVARYGWRQWRRQLRRQIPSPRKQRKLTSSQAGLANAACGLTDGHA